MENFNELTCERTKLDASVTVPSELLHVVDALCKGNTRNSCDDGYERMTPHHGDTKGSNVLGGHDGSNIAEDDNSDSSSYNQAQRYRTFDTMNEVIKFDVTNNSNDNIESAAFCVGVSDKSAVHSSNTQICEKPEEGFREQISEEEVRILHTYENPSEPNQTAQNEARSSPKRRIDIATYAMEGKNIVILPDIYRLVREACGTCNPLRSEVNKLGIIPKRFDPLQMIRLKKVEAVSLDVKCCSYILLEEFLRLIAKYKDKAISPEKINLSPLVNISSERETVERLDNKLTKWSGSPIINAVAANMSPLHTFIINDELVVCTVELQHVFEALFGNVFSMSLTKLGICQYRFTSLQLDEVMDFVDIDEFNMSSAIYYVLKKDTERMFRYAEALFNVDEPQVKWLDPLRLSEDTKHLQVKNQIATLVKSQGNSELHVSGSSNSEVNPQRIDSQSAMEAEEDLVECCALEKNDCHADNEDLVEACSSERLPEKEEIMRQTSASKETSCDLDPLLPPERFQTMENKSEPLGPSQHVLQSRRLSDEEVPESREVTTIDLIPSPGDQDSVSSPASAVSVFSDVSDSCSSIYTYLIDGNEVVCIPDIHKIVIHLYGQSVQVGYYLQRLQIPTQRFSTVHVKRLKALNALNSKATLCTYILKSDALRLLKMYDVFCTESKLHAHHIQWHGPASLKGVQSATLLSDEATTSPENTSTAQEPLEVLKIPTFLINGEVVVSVPDAHKVVQVLNGQSVQVRYNMDKLGIVKRRYSYSQVYQLRAISDLKRPSMCTFITKSDADKLLDHYLTAENASRLKYIQWSTPVRLEELPVCGESSIASQDYSTCGVVPVDAGNAVGLDGNEIQQSNPSFEQKGVETGDLYEGATEPAEPRVPSQSEVAPEGRQTENSMGTESRNDTADEIRHSQGNQTECNTRELEPILDPIVSSCQDPCSGTESTRISMETAIEATERTQQHVENCQIGKKRTYDEFKDKESVFLEVKRMRDEKNEIAATLERKETEMRILHDAYQQQVAGEREKRLAADKETAELKASNVELRKTLQRKESEMKILHDSYQFQIRKEREKREELENDLIDLRGSVAFASGVSIRDPNIKQESI